MAHDEEHRTIIRLEIESALRKYLVSDNADVGMNGDKCACETPPRVFPANGGTLAIGCGCFLIRPGKPSPLGDGESSSPASPQDDIKDTADIKIPFFLSETILPPKSTTNEDAKPPRNVPATAGTVDDEAGPSARRSFLSIDESMASRRVDGGDNHAEELRCEASTSNPIAANDEGARRDSPVARQ